MRKLLLLAFILPQFCFAQLTNEEIEYIDSLKDVTLNAKHDSTIIKAWKAWDNVIYNSDPELDYALNVKIDSLASINLDKELGDQESYFFLKAKATALNILGIIHRDRSEYQKAIVLYEESIQVQILIDNPSGVSNAMTNLGNVYNDQGDYYNAINCQMQSLKIDEAAKDSLGMAGSYNNIGIVYEKLQDFRRAIEFYNKSLRIKQKLDDKVGMANSLNNLGIAYQMLHVPDSALIYHEKSLAIERELGNVQGEARSLINIGEVHADKQEYEMALDFFEKGLELQFTIDDPYGTIAAHIHIASVYENQKKSNLAVQHYQKSLALAQQVGAVRFIGESAEPLYRLYKDQGRSALALEMHELYITSRDSVFSETNKQEIIRQEYKYEYEKQSTADSIKSVEAVKVKEAELQLEKSVTARQRSQTYYLYGVLGIFALFGAFIYNRFRVTQRQKRIIEDQKSMVVKAYDQLEEKNTEILDSITYAKRIQTAILPPLKSIKDQLKDSFILYIPKDIVAGDFYWLETINEHTMFAVADCTGHGVPGAMVSVICNNGLNRSVREQRLTIPGEILDNSREIVIQEFQKSEESVHDGMDIAMISFKKSDTPDDFDILFSGAHNPLWVIKKGSDEITEIRADKQHIGQFHYSKPFTTHSIKLSKGDLIYLFSDGYADQFGGDKGRKMKTSRFREILIEVRNLPLDEQKKVLEKEFHEWKGDLEQIDDVCVAGFRL